MLIQLTWCTPKVLFIVKKMIVALMNNDILRRTDNPYVLKNIISIRRKNGLQPSLEVDILQSRIQVGDCAREAQRRSHDIFSVQKKSSYSRG